MAQIKCKHGHYYNDEIYSSCPYCADKIPVSEEKTDFEERNAVQENTDLKEKSNLKIFAVIAAILAVASFFLPQQNQAKLTQIRREYFEKKAAYEEFVAVASAFGRGPEEFYSDVPFLTLDANGSAKSFSTHGDFIKIMNRSAAVTEELKTYFSYEWVGDDVKITPGANKGLNFIHFTNKKNKDIFDVLVIIK